MRIMVSLVVASMWLLSGCGASPGASSGDPGLVGNPSVTAPATPPPARVEGGSIGTVGGGGTVISSFRLGALLADKVMENTPALPRIAGDDKLQDFYRRHRGVWRTALGEFVRNSGIVKETNDALSENGLARGALSVPAKDPKHVYLCLPYLTMRDGFSETKAFALAMHEAAHFAFPTMTAEEHQQVDQVASLLVGKYVGVRPGTREYRVPFHGWYTPKRLTSDGSRFFQFPGNGSIEITHLETKWLETIPKADFFANPGPSWLGGDWVQIPLDDKTLRIRNLLTNQMFDFDVSEFVTGHLGNEKNKSFVENETFHYVTPSVLVERDLRTGAEKKTQIPARGPALGISFSASRKTVARPQDTGFAFLDMVSGEVLEFARTLSRNYEAKFLDENRILVRDWTGIGGDPYRRRIVSLSDGKVHDLNANGVDLARKGDKLYFTGDILEYRPRDTSTIVEVDINTLRRTVIDLPGKVVREVVDGMDGFFLVKGKDEKPAYFTPGEELRFIEGSSEKEQPVWMERTTNGRALLTLLPGEGREGARFVIRFLDR